MEHIGGYCFFKEAVAVIANRRGNAADPHVFAGWTSIYDKGLWYISDAELYDLLRITGTSAQIFGLDFPYRDAQYFKAAIGRILGLDISEDAKAQILGKNLANALNVAL